MTTTRYDGQTEWYESFAAGPLFVELRETAVRLAGMGPGLCLDLGCGTGRTVQLLADAGWTVVGADVSNDQLDAAHATVGDVARGLIVADAHALPFADQAFDAVVSVLTHTDFEDLAQVMREVARVLRPGGTLAYAGVHPCFASPFVQQASETEPARLHPGYRRAGWNLVSRNPAKPGVSSRVGIHHIPLAQLLNAVLQSGLVINEVVEPGETDPPLFLGFRAEKR